MNRTRTARIRRIIADKNQKIRVNPPSPRHPRSINLYTDMKTALGFALRLRIRGWTDSTRRSSSQMLCIVECAHRNSDSLIIHIGCTNPEEWRTYDCLTEGFSDRHGDGRRFDGLRLRSRARLCGDA